MISKKELEEMLLVLNQYEKDGSDITPVFTKSLIEIVERLLSLLPTEDGEMA